MSLLDDLDRLRDVKGSVEIFDALAVDDAPAVAAALARFPRHPLAAALTQWLAARGLEGPRVPSPAEVATKLGIDDLEAHLDAENQLRTRLERSLEAASSRAERAETVANAYAAILVVVALVAALGWLAALGALPLLGVPTDGEERPAPPPAPAAR